MRLPKLHLRFSLRILLLFTCLVGFLLVPFCIKLDRAKKQREFVMQVTRNGGSVIYDSWLETGEPPVETTVRRWLGNDFFDKPYHVRIEGQPRSLSHGWCLTDLHLLTIRDPTSFDMASLPPFTQLEELILENFDHFDFDAWLEGSSADTFDLRFIGRIATLKRLDLSFIPVRDVQELSGLDQLEVLSLRGTNVVDIRPLSQLSSLRELDLVDTRVTDLWPLQGLRSLSTLYVGPDHVTESEREQLSRALPELDIMLWE